MKLNQKRLYHSKQKDYTTQAVELRCKTIVFNGSCVIKRLIARAGIDSVVEYNSSRLGVIKVVPESFGDFMQLR